MTNYECVSPVLIYIAPFAPSAIAIHHRGLHVIWRNGAGHVMGPRVREMPRQAFAIALVEVHLEGVVFGSKCVGPITNGRDRRINREKRPPGCFRAYTWNGLIGIYNIHHAIGPRPDVSDRQ